MGESYYEVLEVEPDAAPEEIESAYRDRVLEAHPDHSDAPDAAERFQRVRTAKAVLTDGAERARYDRLGHEAYVGLARRTPDDSSDADDETDVGDDADGTTATDRSRATDDRTSATSTGGTSSGAATETGGTTTANGRQTGDRTDRGRTNAADGATGRASSHHARQRSRRRQQRATRRAAGDWPFGDDDDGGGGPAGTAATDEPTADEFSYSVHDWDGEVDLEWEGPSFDRSTAMTVGAVALLYPLFVAASVTPMFSLPINAIVAACTLVFAGYLLMVPRLGMAAFGAWSVLFPLGMVGFSLVDPISVVGLVALAFAWIPLGYAIALWWVLRP